MLTIFLNWNPLDRRHNARRQEARQVVHAKVVRVPLVEITDLLDSVVSGTCSRVVRKAGDAHSD